MKAIILAAVLGLTATAASADTYSGPPGMYDEPANIEQAPPQRRAQRPRNDQLRAEIIARFDKNGDGRLDKQERRHALRALKRIARRLRREAKRQHRQQPQQGDFDIDIDIR